MSAQLTIKRHGEAFSLVAGPGMGPHLTPFLARCRLAGLRYDRCIGAQVGDVEAMARAVRALLNLDVFRFDVAPDDAQTIAMAAPAPAADDLGGQE